MHSDVFNVPRLFRSTEVGLADECLPAAVGHSPRSIAVRGLSKSYDSNRLPVKKKRSFPHFLTPALPFRCGGGGDRRGAATSSLDVAADLTTHTSERRQLIKAAAACIMPVTLPRCMVNLLAIKG